MPEAGRGEPLSALPGRAVRRDLTRSRATEAEALPRGITDILQQVETGRFYVHLEHKSMEPSVNRLVFGLLTSALFVGSSLLWSFKVPPVIGEVSVLGAAGCVTSAVLAFRLLWAIRKSGHLDQRS